MQQKVLFVQQFLDI